MTISFNKPREQTTKGGRLVLVLLSILPIIDTLNGFFPKVPIGKVYKMSLGLIVLGFLLIKHRKLKSKYLGFLVGTIAYISLSISINIFLGGRLINIEYPLKLIFNVILMTSLIQCVEYGLFSGSDFYFVLNLSSWLFLGCYLIPYCLGIGNSVYSGGVGYKAFFIAQNELGLVIVVFFFFTAYQLIYKISFVNICKLACLLLCGMLLNTKTSIAACVIAIFVLFLTIVLRSKPAYKILVILLLIVGLFVFKGTISKAINGVQNRFNVLTAKYYDGSAITGLLSGRNYFVMDAWKELNTHHTLLRFFIGNGFCSDVLIEMDILDIFFYLGAIGVIFIIIVLFFFFKMIVHNSREDIGNMRIISYLVILAQLSIAGHVLFMAMSGCYFILYLCFLLFYKEVMQDVRVGEQIITCKNCTCLEDECF